jgi:aryl-alcohol dehydrogenase-like predicted oxidoreductase
VVIATKFGFKLDPTGERAWVGLDSRPEHIKEAAEGSIKRLKVEAIERSVALTQSSRSLRYRVNTRRGGDRPEGEVLPTLEELGVGFVAYSPLGKGFLTGKINETTTFDSSDFRNTLPRFTPEARKANQAMIDLLSAIAKRKKATPAQIALAGLLAQKRWIVPIPGTTKLHRLKENIGAAAIELTSDDLREIDSAASKIAVKTHACLARRPSPHVNR